MKITIDSGIPFIKGIFEPFAEVRYIPGKQIDASTIRDCDAMIIRTRTRCDKNLLENSRIRMIATATIGFDHIDLEYCRRNGIEVATAAGCNSRGVLQWVSSVLAKLSEQDGWLPTQRTLGVVGVGHIGSLVAEYASRWGFRVLCCDPPRQRAEKERLLSEGRNEADGATAGFVPFETLAAQSDIITFHVPLQREGDDATWHITDKAFFEIIKPGATILNSSRGEVVDNALLREAVEAGHCRACLDVWEHEPDIDRRLLASALVSTPHIAGYSAQGKANATAMAVAAVARHFGLPVERFYPETVERIQPRPIGWDEMKRTIGKYCDIDAESAPLRNFPERFEALRDNYRYRQEYF